ncbi:MAG: LolA family protein [Candidatus Halalkalibacterium sp. M3_1C_030]
MKVNYFPAIFVAILLFAITAFSSPLFAQQTAFDKLKQRFDEGEIFHAEFQHRYIDSYTQDTVSSKGTIWVGEDKYKVRTQNQSVVVDGETSMVFDDSRNRVILSKYEPAEDDFAPSRILNGADSTYTIESQERHDGKVFINLVSEDPFAVFQKVEITLTNLLMPLRIFAKDQADNLITTSFKEGKFIAPEQGMFNLDYPEGAEIVDMRNKP